MAKKRVKKGVRKVKSSSKKSSMAALKKKIMRSLPARGDFSDNNSSTGEQVSVQRKHLSKVAKAKLSKKNPHKKTEHIFTGIEGFDALLDKGIPKGAGVLIAGGAGSGKCLDFNEKIPVRINNKWNVIKIGELVEEQLKQSKEIIKEGMITHENKDDIEILTFDQNSLKIKFKRITAFGKKRAPEKLLRIRTDSGRDIITTKDHNFITLRQGVLKVTDSKGLQIDNVLPIAGKLPFFKKNNSIDIFSLFKDEKLRVWVDRELESSMPEIKNYISSNSVREEHYLQYRSLPVNDFVPLLSKYGRNILNKCLLVQPSSSNNPTPPILNLDADWGYVFGFYAAEGHTPKGYSPVISTGSEFVVESLKSSATNIGINNVHVYKDKSCFSLRLSKMFYPLFKQFGSNAGAKKIPDFMLDVDNAITDSFLDSYFFGDGWIENKSRNRNLKQTKMQYACSKSKELLYGLNLLTLRKGNVLRFLERIVEGKKYHTANYCVNAEHLRKFDIIPGAGKLFRKIRKEHNIYGDAVFYRFYENGQRNFTRNSLSKALTKLEILEPKVKDNKEFSWLKTLAHADVLWDKITEIKECTPSTEWVYDLQVDETHNFMTFSGIFVHNTIFCLQKLHYHATHGDKCLYMSFEESEDKLIKHMSDFGWEPEKLIKEGKLMIKRFNPFDITRSVDALLMKAKGELLIDIEPVILPKNFRPSIIAVDSLTAIASAFSDKEDTYRIYIEQLFRFFENLGATSLMITETEQIPKIFSKTGVEEFLADGVVVLYNIQHGNVRENAIEILKMRGVRHQKKIVAMQVTSNGIVVYPDQEVFGDF